MFIKDELNEFDILYGRLNEPNTDLFEIITAGRLILHDFVQTVNNWNTILLISKQKCSHWDVKRRNNPCKVCSLCIMTFISVTEIYSI